MCERFFTQTTRFRDLHGDLSDAFSEMQLIDTVVLPEELSLQEFHSFASKYDLIWMSEGAFITTGNIVRFVFKDGPVTEESVALYSRTLGTYQYYLTANFSGMNFSVCAASHGVATVHSDFLVGLFARSNMPDVLFHAMALGFSRRPLLPVSGEALTELLMQGNCRKLVVYKFHMNESHFHALRRANSGLKLSLASFNFTAVVDATAFVECLQGMLCSLDMIWDDVNAGVLAQALPGASHLQTLTLDKPENEQTGSLFQFRQANSNTNTALVESFQANTGLAELKVSTEFDDFDFPSLCRSLRSHTTLTSLTVYIPVRQLSTFSISRPARVLSEENKTVLLEGVHGLLKTNTVLYTIKLPWCLIGTPIYEEEMIPRLEMNRFRRYFLAIKTAPAELRIKLLCAALPLVSTTNLIFEVFRDSVDVLLPMLLADDMKAQPLGAPSSKEDLKAEVANLAESFEMKDLLLELLGMAEES
jgi:hypothetical protein